MEKEQEIIIAETYKARDIFTVDKEASIVVAFEDGFFVSYVISHEKKHYIGKIHHLRHDIKKITWRRLELAIKYLMRHFNFDERVSLIFKMDFSKPSAGLNQWYERI